MKKTITAGTIGLAMALVAAPQAVASTVTVSGGNTVRVLETGNEPNDVAVSYASGTDLYTVSDTAADLTPSGTCTTVDAHTATCPGAGIKTVSVDTGDRDDSIALDPATIPSTVSESLDGGPGNDFVSGANSPGSVRGGSGNDNVIGRGTVDGESGNDTVVGSTLADNIRGGGGRDLVNGGDGPDDIAGGSSSDTLVYPADRQAAVSVTIGTGNNNDGGPEDLASGRHDTVHGDIEAVIGTSFGDVLIGDNSSETLFGGTGDDLLVGNGGNDTLGGFNGNDLLSGGQGHDTLRGSFGNDRLLGGPGNDRLAAGPDDDFLKGKSGHDVMKGKTGIDTIRAKDHTHDVKISCGPGPNGRESATRDRHLDPPAKSC